MNHKTIRFSTRFQSLALRCIALVVTAMVPASHAGDAPPPGMSQMVGTVVSTQNQRDVQTAPDFRSLISSLGGVYEGALGAMYLLGSGETHVETYKDGSTVTTTATVLDSGEVQYVQSRAGGDGQASNYTITFSADGQSIVALETDQGSYRGKIPLNP